jgi:hypothetical protein
MDFKNKLKQNNKEIVNKWWNSMTFEEKFYKTIESNSILKGDTVDNHPDKLKEEDIIKIFEWHFKNIL